MKIFAIIAITIGIIALFFVGAYMDKKRNENDLDEYLDERNRNL